MAASLLIPLCLCILLLRGASAVSDQQEAGRRDSCDRIDRRIRALEPTRRVDSEAGHTELYDDRDGQLPCAGVAAARITIQRNGLLLPSYSNSPRLAYIVHGRGIVGVVIPGCPETYQETSSSSSQEQEDDERRRRGRRGDEERRRSSEGEEEEEEEETSRRSFEQSIRDEHQRITTVRQGDVVAIPAGAPFWVHNDGDSPLVAISVHDVSNSANQLDQTSRRFRLAGGQARSEGRQRYGEGESSESETERGGEESYNILSGFDTELLAESMRVSPDIARKLQGRSDKRGNIVRVRRGGLRMLRPATERVTDEEMMRGANAAAAAGNGIDEAVCLMKLRENVADPMKADLYTPNGGRITVLNSQKLPVLKLIKMSVNRGVMRRNAILAPHWNINAHAAVYATSGSARLQVVSSEGRRVFDGELRRGQMVVVPQSFAVAGRAGDEGFAWVSFQTSDGAMNAPVVGKSSALRGMPADVLANAFGVSREEARMVKFGRGQELAIFSPKSGAAARRRRSPGHRDDGVLAAPA
ncbi:hypothetical protein OsI_27675 [Oryza sativa Indica Group]|nr:hypothetical protein OsI_27675 [Oryza sativa Indica Group]